MTPLRDPERFLGSGRPGAAASAPPARASFRKVVLWVALAHLVLLALIGFWRFPAKAPAAGGVMEFVALPSQQPSPAPVSGSSAPAQEPPAAAPPAPTPAAPSPPVEPTPPPDLAPPAPVAEEPRAPAPAPSAPSAIVIPPKPTLAPAPPAQTEKGEKKKKKKKEKARAAPGAEASADAREDAPPAKPAPHLPKVNLQEVDRSAVAKGVAGGKGTQPNESQSPQGEGNGLTASGVKEALSKSLNSSGADSRVVGPASGGGGGGEGDPSYYGLIREAMYGAWDQPSELAGQHLRTKISIHIAADGTVSGAAIAVSSGNAVYDASALDAARRVTRLAKPRPDSIPEAVAVNFEIVQ